MLKRERLSEANAAGPLFLLDASSSSFMALSESEGGKKGESENNAHRHPIPLPRHNAPGHPSQEILGFGFNGQSVGTCTTRYKVVTRISELPKGLCYQAVINRGMIRPMLRHYYRAEASAGAESVEILSIRHLPRLRQYAKAPANNRCFGK